MTRDVVYLARTGTRYHVDEQCSGLDEANRPLRHSSLQQAVAEFGRTACTVCCGVVASVVPAQWADHPEKGLVETDYEALFFDHVLAKVPDLNPTRVHSQYDVTDAAGRARRLDFAIVDDGVRVGIELNGYDKTGAGRGPSKSEFEDSNRRLTDLQAMGWIILPFDNNLARTDPGACARRVDLALREQRVRFLATQQLQGADTANGPAASASQLGQQDALVTGAAKRRPKRSFVLVGAATAMAAGVVATVAFVAAGGSPGVAPSGYTCPTDHPIKGNNSLAGDKIFHDPGDQFYDRTRPERCFSSAAEAEAAGYRASRS
ncbi:MAG TPA: hypothetical protein VFY10_12010 [Dehalococcoidia bacterium]|nr:hypothetical protein [Dehalococcoidia bacterium]